MRRFLPALLTLCLPVGFAGAADKPQLELSDPKLALQELRPLDRRAYVLALDGKWNQPAKPGAPYYVNVFLPGGGSYSHRAVDDPGERPGEQRVVLRDAQGRLQTQPALSLFRQGEVKVLIQDHQLARHGFAKGGKLIVVVSAGQPASSPAAAEVVSNGFTFEWPMDRPVVPEPVRTKFTPPAPLDALPRPDAFKPPQPVPPPAPLDALPRPDAFKPPQPVPPPKPDKD